LLLSRRSYARQSVDQTNVVRSIPRSGDGS
jgi:hypothetical protein